MSDPIAGRALDREIATKVMGWTPLDAKYLTQLMSPPSDWGNRGTGFVWFSGTRACEVPHFSTSIADAWLVVEKMARCEPDPWMITLMNWNYYGDPTTTAKFATHALGPDPVEVRAASAPLAICLAALLTVEHPAEKQGGRT